MTQQDGTTRFPPGQVASDLGDIAHDVLELAELQAGLFKVDAADAFRQLLLPAGLLLVSTAVGLGCVPVLLASIALALVSLGVDLWLAFLTASAVGVAAATAAFAVGWSRLRVAASLLDRSKRELAQNVSWLKLTLAHRRQIAHREAGLSPQS